MVDVEPRKLLPEGPARVGLPFGLSSVVNLSSGPDHWENGVTWEAIECDPASGIGNIDCNDAGTGLPRIFQDGVPIADADPFVIYASHLCSPIGNGANALQRSQDLATRKLLAREGARAEQAFWTGDLNNTPNLQGATDLNPAGAVAAPIALGLLEDFMGDTYGSLGVIHMSRKAAPTLFQSYLLEPRGGSLRTQLDTPVAVGAGYPGTGPAGQAAAAGESWLYVTPAVFGYRSDIGYDSDRVGDLLDRATNDLYGIAERWYLLGFDPCGVGAVRVTLGCC